MKKQFRIFAAFLTFVLFTSIQISTMAQDKPPPPPPNGHGLGGNQAPAAGAPIGNGTFILLTLAAAYAGRKIYISRIVSAEE